MTLPLITSAPHDAETFSTFSPRCALDPWQIGEFSDKYTAVTAYHPNALGNLKSKVTRGLGSLNQPRDKSLFRTVDFHGNTIWKAGQELTDEEKEACFVTFYDPYYEEIKKLIKKSKKEGFDKVILWDQHDTGDFDRLTGKRDRILPEEPRTMPKFVLSNLGKRDTGEIEPEIGFASCDASFIQAVKHFIFEEFKIDLNDIEINTIYKGRNLMRTFADPKNDFGNTVVGIQIEYNRGFIMDQATREPYKEKLKEFNGKFRKVMEKACSII